MNTPVDTALAAMRLGKLRALDQRTLDRLRRARFGPFEDDTKPNVAPAILAACADCTAEEIKRVRNEKYVIAKGPRAKREVRQLVYQQTGRHIWITEKQRQAIVGASVGVAVSALHWLGIYLAARGK